MVGYTSAGRPLRSFMPSIRCVNQQMRAALSRSFHAFGTAVDSRLKYIDCGSAFLGGSADGRNNEVREELMPDRIHPNRDGIRVWLQCLRAHV